MTRYYSNLPCSLYTSYPTNTAPQLEVYEEQRSVMEEQQMKLAERFVRNSRARRSFSRTNSTSNLNNTNASDNDSEGVNGTSTTILKLNLAMN